MSDPCRWCGGKGWTWARNGPDDVDKEPCHHCWDAPVPKKSKVQQAIDLAVAMMRGEKT